MAIVFNEEDFLPENKMNLLYKLDELTDAQLEILDSTIFAVKTDREYRGEPRYVVKATMRKLNNGNHP